MNHWVVSSVVLQIPFPSHSMRPKLPLFVWSFIYRKNSKNSDTRKICSNHPKIRTRWLYRRVMLPKDADGIANSVDPDQTAPLVFQHVLHVSSEDSSWHAREYTFINMFKEMVLREKFSFLCVQTATIGRDCTDAQTPLGYVINSVFLNFRTDRSEQTE